MGLRDRLFGSVEDRQEKQARRQQSAEDREQERRNREYVVRAHRQGVIHRSEYLDREDEQRSLAVGDDGQLNAVLRRAGDRLVIVTPLGMVNPKSTYSWRLGLFSFALRGSSHYENALRRGDFAPGAALRLVREPDNPYDENAIAVYADRASAASGYVNKTNAKRLAPMLDRGDDLVAISTRGSRAGKDETTPHVLVCERSVMQHLLRDL